MESSPARRAGGALAAVAGVAALLVVAGLASRPEGVSGRLPPGDDATGLVLDVVSYLLVAATLLSLLLMVWALWPRPDEELPPLPPRRRWPLGMLVSAAVTLAVVLWLHRGPAGRLPGVGPAGPPARPGGSQPVAPGAGPAAGVDWPALVVVACLLVAALIAVCWALRRSRRPSGPASRGRVAALLDDGIDDVLREPDPRRAVIAAWARLERVLTGHGLPRRQAEAPLEYAARARAALLGPPVVPLERLAGLFEWARFSPHEVTPAMREEALSGLVAVRDGLRLAGS